MSRHSPWVPIKHMLDYAREAQQLVAGRSRANLDDDRLLQLALMRVVEVIGEAAARLPAEFRASFPQVEWVSIVGMRNRLIHAYDFVDYDILWAVATEEVPPLIAQLEEILQQEET